MSTAKQELASSSQKRSSELVQYMMPPSAAKSRSKCLFALPYLKEEYLGDVWQRIVCMRLRVWERNKTIGIIRIASRIGHDKFIWRRAEA